MYNGSYSEQEVKRLHSHAMSLFYNIVKKRDVISEEDIMTVRINANVCKDVNEFIEKM